MDKIILHIDYLYSTISGLSSEMSEDLYDLLSFKVPGAEFIIEHRPNWDGKIRLYKKYNQSFLTGLCYKACDFLIKKYKVKLKIINHTEKPKKNIDLKWNDKKYEIRDYQRTLIDIMKNKGRSILNAATGSGKTIIVSKVIQELGVSPFIFYVLSKDLMYQAKERLEDSIPNIKVGIIGDGICDIKPISVVTVQSAMSALKINTKKELENFKKYANMDEVEFKSFKNENMTHMQKKKSEVIDYIKNAKGIYADETHHFASKICKKVMLLSPKAYYRFGGSATPVRGDNAYLIIEGLFGRSTAVVTASELIEKGVLMQPKINFIELQSNKIIANTWAQDRKENIVENGERNECIVNLANELQERNISTLILIQVIKHGKFLQKRIKDSVFVYGNTKKEKRKKYLKDFENGKINTMIASIIADEGLDIPTLSVLINAGGGKSPTRAKQRVGRVIRKGSSHAIVYDFMDKGRWSKKHSLERIKMLKEEEKFIIKRIKSEEVLKETREKDLF